MKRLLPFIALTALTGCQQAAVVKQGIDAVFAAGVSAYCKLPETARLINRGRIAAKIAPNEIEIHCASPSQPSPRWGEGQGGGMEG